MAPFIPLSAGVSTTSAPSALSSRRRSTLMLSGIVKMQRYPFAAQTKARAMPVLPLVGSTITLSPVSLPACSAFSIMLKPMRSFTLPSGFMNSHLASTVA